MIFREPASGQEAVASAKNWAEFKPMLEVSGAWNVSFDPKWGGPATPVSFDKLQDWSKHSEPGIRYYSGTAVYNKTFDVPQTQLGSLGSSSIWARSR